jgi:hypothetical protein
LKVGRVWFVGIVRGRARNDEQMFFTSSAIWKTKGIQKIGVRA